MLFWECQDFPGALPDGRDLAHQPAGLIRRMRKANQIWRAFDQFRRASSWAAFQQDHPEAWALRCEVERLREWAGAGNPADDILVSGLQM